jgi:hypothetical protein
MSSRGRWQSTWCLKQRRLIFCRFLPVLALANLNYGAMAALPVAGPRPDPARTATIKTHTTNEGREMKITQSQMAMMAEGPFVEKIGRLLESKFPNPNHRQMPPEFRNKMARHAIFVARSYGLKNERDIASFALAMLNINPLFHLQKRIHEILERKEVSGDERLDRIISDASDFDWEEAGSITDASAYWQKIFAGPDDGTMIPSRATR